jgi:hypothetical protein
MLSTVVSTTKVVTPTCFYALLSVEEEDEEGNTYVRDEFILCLIVTSENHCLDLYAPLPLFFLSISLPVPLPLPSSLHPFASALSSLLHLSTSLSLPSSLLPFASTLSSPLLPPSPSLSLSLTYSHLLQHSLSSPLFSLSPLPLPS